MSLYMNSSQEETFQSLMDYFTGRRYKILVSNSPQLVRAEIGSWMSMTVASGTAKGEAEATIIKRNGGSYVNFNFNFMKEYVSGLISCVLGALIIYAVVYWIGGAYFSRLPSQAVGDVWAIVNPSIIVGIVLLFAIVMSMEGYLVAKTRKRFIAEFNTFAQSLPNKTMMPPPPPT